MKRIIFVLFCFAFISNLYSQSDTAKTGTKVIFFGHSHDSEPLIYNRNAIKTGLTDILSGLYGLHYERELGEYFTIQAGGGITGCNFMEVAFNYTIDHTPREKSNNQPPVSDAQ